MKHLGDLGCRSLKTNPIGDVGEWKKNGYGQAVTMEELFGLYLDYIPHFYEDGMPLSLQLGGFFDTRASDYLALHPECQACEYAPYCLGGCRASALDSNDGTDLMGRDEACCRMLREGYAARVLALMQKIRPEATCFLLRDPFWQDKAATVKRI